MSNEPAAARTPGAVRAGPGQHVFDLGNASIISSAGRPIRRRTGACVEGDRMIVGLMRMPAGTGAEAHSHPNEQWIYILEGTFAGEVDGKAVRGKARHCSLYPGRTRSMPARRRLKATWCSLRCKDASHSLHGIKAG